MVRMRVLRTCVLCMFILLAGRESQAVIYKYVNAKGVPTFADDMQKIPEQYRSQAVIVSGVAVDENAWKENARLAEETPVRQERTDVPARTEERISARLVRSGIAAGLFIAIMFVISNLHVPQEQAQVLLRVRTTLVLLLIAFIGYTHAGDVVGLFGKAAETVSNPITGIQEQSAARGRKAAEAYKSMNNIVEQAAHNEEARQKEIEKKFDEAERGK
jgi:hypothetical protein